MGQLLLFQAKKTESREEHDHTTQIPSAGEGVVLKNLGSD